MPIKRGTPTLLTRADRFVTGALAAVLRETSSWDLRADPDLEVANHVLRVVIQKGLVREHVEQFGALVASQHEDGGWGYRPSDSRSFVRPTGFSTHMLFRANRVLGDERLSRAITRGIAYLLGAQRADGAWDDPRWQPLNATSMAVGALLFGRFLSGVEAATGRAIRFITALPRRDGLWLAPSGHPSVEVTAHFLQKLLPWEASPAVVLPAVEALLRSQSPDGWWEDEDTDATCDAIRALTLAAARRLPGIDRDVTLRACSVGLEWVLSIACPDGIGLRPAVAPDTLHTTDAIDTVLKFQQAVYGHEDLVHVYR